MSEAVATRFIWTTQTGERIPVDRMRTSHLFYSLRMIWNHTALPSMRLPGGHYAAVSHWPAKYRRDAVVAFIAELQTRPIEQLSSSQWQQLAQMAAMGKSAEYLNP